MDRRRERAVFALPRPEDTVESLVQRLDTVAEKAGGTLWFQLYSMWPDRSLSYEIVDRARNAGFDALIFTIDSVVSPNREYNLRNGLRIPFRFRRSNSL